MGDTLEKGGNMEIIDKYDKKSAFKSWTPPNIPM